MKLHLTAIEPSGDLLGREVIDALRARLPDIELVGLGGEQMAEAGVSSDIDTSPLAIVGLLEGVKIWRTVTRLADEVADQIIASAPDAAVLIDSWGFTIRVGERVRKRAPHIRLVKLAGPQIWATRPGRAKSLAATFDQVLCLNALELPYYEPLDIEAALIGNPALSRTAKGDGAAFRTDLGLSSDKPVLLVLPGSRRSEVTRVAPSLLEAASLVKQSRPDVQLVAAPAASIASDFRAICPPDLDILISDDPERRYDAMAAADLALACSGTVTSELAMQGSPMLVAYKLGFATWVLAKYLLYRHQHITIMNIAMDDREIVPEFVQGEMQPEAMAKAALDLLADPERLQAQVDAQNIALKQMGQGEAPTAQRAADAILAGLSMPRVAR